MAVVVALAGVGGSLVNDRPVERQRITPIKTGHELVMVFMASSTCSGVNDPKLERAIERIRLALRREAAARNQVFVTMGVSLDWQIHQGVQLLDRFGPFDEIMVGRGWMNNGAIRFIWKDVPGDPSVPQIIVLQRKVTRSRALSLDEERLRYRKIGANAIIRWSELAFPS